MDGGKGGRREGRGADTGRSVDGRGEEGRSVVRHRGGKRGVLPVHHHLQACCETSELRKWGVVNDGRRWERCAPWTWCRKYDWTRKSAPRGYYQLLEYDVDTARMHDGEEADHHVVNDDGYSLPEEEAVVVVTVLRSCERDGEEAWMQLHVQHGEVAFLKC